MILFRNVTVCRYKYFNNSKKRMKKVHTINTEIKAIALKNLMITRTLKEFSYCLKIIFKNNEKTKKLITKTNKNINEVLNNDKL